MATTKPHVQSSFYYHRGRAQQEHEPFDLSVEQWVDHWRLSEHCGQRGHMRRIFRDMPWSITNIEFVPGTGARGGAAPPRRAPHGRTLTVQQWVEELKARA